MNEIFLIVHFKKIGTEIKNTYIKSLFQVIKMKTVESENKLWETYFSSIHEW